MKRKKKAPAKDGVEIIDMAVSVRVDTITSIDLEKQTFSGDLWVFVMTKDRIHEPVKREKAGRVFTKDASISKKGVWIFLSSLDAYHPRKESVCFAARSIADDLHRWRVSYSTSTPTQSVAVTGSPVRT